MSKKPVLVVMAAGMGSRYGGLKQIDPVGTQGEAILDYSLFDAYQAGFETAVIIIKEAIREEFMQTVGKRLEKCPMEIRYAYQELHKLPAGYTGAPFAVVNADDYYGKSAFRVVYDYLTKAADGEKYDYCMVGYQLGNTVTENGSVARGVCVTENGLLTAIAERTRIEKRPEGIAYTEDGENWHVLPPETPVSMNLWGYTPSFLTEIENRMAAFLEKALAENPNKGEFYLPLLVSDLLQEKKATVTVLRSPDKWYGVTYAADRPQVVAAIAQMTKDGKYPDGLWK